MTRARLCAPTRLVLTWPRGVQLDLSSEEERQRKLWQLGGADCASRSIYAPTSLPPARPVHTRARTRVRTRTESVRTLPDL